MLKIYTFPTFNSLKVLVTAEEAGLEYEMISVDLASGEQRTPEHLRRHPLGKVPVIEDDGLTLFESNAICRYLARTANHELYPASLTDQSLVDQWTDFVTLHVGRWLAQVYWEEVIKQRFNQAPEPVAMQEAQGFLKQQLPVFDAQLQGRDFLATERLSIADIIGFSYFTTQEQTSVDLSEYANIQRWYAAIKSRPAVVRAQQRLGSG